MSEITPFGWKDDESPDITSAHLEQDRNEIGKYAKEQASIAEAASIPIGQKGAPSGVGTLDETGHQPISQSPLSVVNGSANGTLVAGAAVYVSGTPTGVSAHDTKLIEEAITNAGFSFGGDVVLGPGVWALTLKLGKTTEGRNYRIRGSGTYETILKPGSTTEPILTITGPGTVAGEYFELDSLSFCLAEDRAYANPLLKIILQKGQLKINPNVRFYSGEPANPAGIVSHTGTMMVMDGAYEGIIEPQFTLGKYAVPLEFVNETVLPSAGVPPNLDTLSFSTSIIGCMGFIFRDAYSLIGGLDFPRYKITQTTLYASTPWCEAQINTENIVGATTLSLKTVLVHPEAGKTKAAENIVVGDMVTIGCGNSVECNKVTGVEEKGEETVITLAQPLRYAHAAGANAPTLIVGGKSISFGKNYAAITFTAFHFEQQQIGISADRVAGINLLSGRSTVGELVRAEGEVSGVNFGAIQTAGTSNRHRWFAKAAYSTAESGRWGGHTALIPPIPFPGVVFTAKVTSGSEILKEASSTEGLEVGNKIVASGIAEGTTIKALPGEEGLAAGEIKLSAKASTSATETISALPGYILPLTVFNNKAIDYWERQAAAFGLGSASASTLLLNNGGSTGKVQAQEAALLVAGDGITKAQITNEGTVSGNVLAAAHTSSAEASETLTHTSPGVVTVGGSGARTRKLPLISEIEEGRMYIIVDQSGNAAAGHITVEAQSTDKLQGVEKGTAVIEANHGVLRVYNTGAAIGWLLI